MRKKVGAACMRIESFSVEGNEKRRSGRSGGACRRFRASDYGGLHPAAFEAAVGAGARPDTNQGGRGFGVEDCRGHGHALAVAEKRIVAIESLTRVVFCNPGLR
jgi:hypothetical protein